MSRFMFVVPPFYGHITATMSVGKELIQRGHKVCWVSMKEINPDFIPEGGEWIVPQEVIDRQDQLQRVLDRQNLGTVVAENKNHDFYLDETLIPFLHIMLPGMQTVINQFKPDVIAQDESAFAGAAAAVINNIPYATTITVPPGFFEPNLFDLERQKAIGDRALREQAAMGLPTDRVIFNSNQLIISFTAPELLEPHYKNFQFSGPFEFVGPSVEGRPEPGKFDWSQVKNPEWPKIYVSIGTLLDHVRELVFKRIVKAFEGQPLTIFANTDPAIFDQWPDNFIVQKTFPQIDMLSKVDLVITHAGFNTVNEALYFDLPMIALPIAWDQGVNADLIQIHGCGKKLKYRRLSEGLLRDTVMEVLNDERYRQNAQRLGQALRNRGGSKRAADLLEQLVPTAERDQ